MLPKVRVSLAQIQLITFPDPRTQDRKTTIPFFSAVPLPKGGRARRYCKPPRDYSGIHLTVHGKRRQGIPQLTSNLSGNPLGSAFKIYPELDLLSSPFLLLPGSSQCCLVSAHCTSFLITLLFSPSPLPACSHTVVRENLLGHKSNPVPPLQKTFCWLHCSSRSAPADLESFPDTHLIHSLHSGRSLLQ